MAHRKKMDSPHAREGKGMSDFVSSPLDRNTCGKTGRVLLMASPGTQQIVIRSFYQQNKDFSKYQPAPHLSAHLFLTGNIPHRRFKDVIFKRGKSHRKIKEVCPAEGGVKSKGKVSPPRRVSDIPNPEEPKRDFHRRPKFFPPSRGGGSILIPQSPFARVSLCRVPSVSPPQLFRVSQKKGRG